MAAKRTLTGVALIVIGILGAAVVAGFWQQLSALEAIAIAVACALVAAAGMWLASRKSG